LKLFVVDMVTQSGEHIRNFTTKSEILYPKTIYMLNLNATLCGIMI